MCENTIIKPATNHYAIALQKVCTDYTQSDCRSNFDSAAKMLAEYFLEDKKGKILKLALNGDITQDELLSLIENIDIETLHSEDALLFAYAKQLHSTLDFGKYNEPRLKGLIQYHRFDNLRWLSFFSETVSSLNKAGNIPMASYGISMKYYRKDCYSLLSDDGITSISKEQYKSFYKFYKNAGYTTKKWINSFEIDGKKNGDRMFVYNGIISGDNTAGHIAENISKRAFSVDLFNAKYMIPSPEDMVFLMINSIWRALRYNLDFNGIAFILWDLYCFLSDRDISTERLYEIVLENNMSAQYYFLSHFINEVYNGCLCADKSDAEKHIQWENDSLLKAIFDHSERNEAITQQSENDSQLKAFLDRELHFVKKKYKENGELKFKWLYDIAEKTGLLSKMPRARTIVSELKTLFN